MKRLVLFSIFLLCSITYSQNISIPADTIVDSYHQTTINGQLVKYKAEVGTQPVWNQKGEPIATLFYTYYTRVPLKNSKINRAERPIIISFNGGPGSGSLWMHIAYTGPRVLKIDDEGFPVQPYGMKNNPSSILDVADIVYVNPVNTGYSRMIADSKGNLPDKKLFFGINADIKYLAGWINTFITRKNRWESPKYIIGESYGGTRVMGLAHELQNRHWMYLNGVIMVSPADYRVYDTGGAVSSAINLPYYTAAAWYHKVLDKSLQERDLLEILPESEDFTINKLIPAIAKGGFISDSEKESVAKKMSYYSGISYKDIIRHNLDLPTNFFWKELLRDESGHTIGRLDSRYLGLDKMEAGSRPDSNAELDSWEHSFTPAINYYFKNELNFSTDIKYNVFGSVHPWNRENDNTRDNLRQAMAQNPYLKVLIQSGYYDGATTYFQGKYTMWQIDPSGKMKDRFTFKGYRSGHMMYLRSEDLKSSNDDLRDFIKNSLTNGKSAKY
ncbi:MAG: carboxypeptidase [Bacteroidota bacterium]|nr:carboxypeptidase [Bacteroidota bacterium]